MTNFNKAPEGEGGHVRTDRSTDYNETRKAEAHTHVFGTEEVGGVQGIPHSWGDVHLLRKSKGKENSVSFIESENKRFALIITDTEKAKKFFKNNLQKKIKEDYIKAQRKASSVQEKKESHPERFRENTMYALTKTIEGDNGIKLYVMKDEANSEDEEDNGHENETTKEEDSKKDQEDWIRIKLEDTEIWKILNKKQYD